MADGMDVAVNENILKDNNLLAEDLKGIKIDFNF